MTGKIETPLDKSLATRVYYNVRREVPLATHHNHDPDPTRLLADAYDTHGTGLYRYALVLCARPAMAEDALQQAFAKLAALGPRIAAIESLGDYLRAAVRNECHRLLQIPRLVGLDDDNPPALLEAVDAGMQMDDQRRALESALAALPAEQREIVHLKVYEDQTFQQIAALLQIPANTAASRYRYALDKLREHLSQLQKNET